MEKREKTVRQRAADAYSLRVYSRADLLATGMSSRDITDAVRSGRLLRIRRDRYGDDDLPDDVIEAVRIGGRLSCLSLLKSIGVFVLSCTALHVHVRPGSSRLREPRAEGTVLHWDTWSGVYGTLHSVVLLDAIRHSLRCQTPRGAIATLDSLMHHRILSRRQLKTVLDAMPSRFAVLLALVDPSAESGPETFVRLMLRALGVAFESQVLIPGIGRVDFVVEGWLIIECDSKEFHEGWDKQVEDRARDMAAARLGYVTIRPLAADVMYQGDDVRAAIQEVLEAFGPLLTSPHRS